jgi:hypothetical protein
VGKSRRFSVITCVCCVVLFLIRRCRVLNRTLLQIYRYLPSYLRILLHFSRFINIAVFCPAVFVSVPRNLSLLFKLWHLSYLSPVRSPVYRYLLTPTQGPYPPLPNTFCTSWRPTPLFVCRHPHSLVTGHQWPLPTFLLYPLVRKLAELPTDGRESVTKRKTSSSQRIELRSVTTVCSPPALDYSLLLVRFRQGVTCSQCGGIRLPPRCDWDPCSSGMLRSVDRY